MLTRILMLFLIALAALSGFSSFRLLRAHIAAEVYRERLSELSADYEGLLDLYSEAVRRTAVTELLVTEDSVTVLIRTAQGQLHSIATPFDPGREIYVDYVVLNGRLWIRRLFDDTTAPNQGLLIAPELAAVDWNAEGASHGKATYRSLDPGRWVVDVTGDGSLGLAKRSEDDRVDLAPAPPVRDYEPIEYRVNDAISAIGPAEAFEVLWRQLETGR